MIASSAKKTALTVNDAEDIEQDSEHRYPHSRHCLQTRRGGEALGARASFSLSQRRIGFSPRLRRVMRVRRYSGGDLTVRSVKKRNGRR